MRANWTIAAAALVTLGCTGLAEAKDTQFWNLTANTITAFQVSAPGKNEWGVDQTANDPDHTVEFDERLKIKGVATGVYDVKFKDQKGRVCVVPNVAIKQGGVFSIEEKKLPSCAN